MEKEKYAERQKQDLNRAWIIRDLCQRNSWFTMGTNSQYEKLSRASKEGADLKTLATIIWLCTDETEWTYEEIYEELRRKLG